MLWGHQLRVLDFPPCPQLTVVRGSGCIQARTPWCRGMITSKCNPWAAPGTEEPRPAWLSHTVMVPAVHSCWSGAKVCLGQNRKRQHFPCHESAKNLGPRDVGVSVQSSSCSRNQQKLHLIWLHCHKCHSWVRNAAPRV